MADEKNSDRSAGEGARINIGAALIARDNAANVRHLSFEQWEGLARMMENMKGCEVSKGFVEYVYLVASGAKEYELPKTEQAK